MDPVDSVRSLYLDGMGTVPYATFMKCFNALLDDPGEVTPKEPSEDLYESFGAVCMALNLGIRDELDRGEERREEFMEKIYPLWEEQVPEEKMQEFESLLEGTSEEKGSSHGDRDKERRFQQAEQALDAALREIEAQQPGGAGRRTTGQAESSDEGEAAPAPTQEEEAEEAEEAEEEAQPSEFSSVTELTDLLAAGQVEGEYHDRKDREPHFRYEYNEEEVSVRLIKAGPAYYTILSFRGIPDRTPEVGERLQEFMTKKGYERAGDYSYSKTSADYTCKITLSEKRLALALKYGKPLKKQALAKRIKALHSLMQALVERVLQPSG
jgi:hypothetical protein